MRDNALRVLEVLAAGTAALPVIRLDWWSAAITLPAVLVAVAADRAQRRPVAGR